METAVLPTRPSMRTVPAPTQDQPQPLDGVRTVLWDAFKHLFPPHAIALQNERGSVLISWSMADDPYATLPYAAPVVLRFEPELLEMMDAADDAGQRRIAIAQEQYLRAGLVGYDPYAVPPKARIIVLG
jgi:hypothetical protein